MGAAAARSGADREQLDVLNLSPVRESSFYRTQVTSLAEQNVRGETLVVPGRSDGTESDESRTALDYLRFLPRVRREVGVEYDLVHANYGLTAPHALAQRRLPVVLSLWGTDVYGPYGWLSRACAPLCDAVIVVADHMGERLSCEYTVIPHGVDLDRFQPAPATEARSALGWDDDGYHVLFPAPPDRPEKDFPRARRVVEAARDRLDGPIALYSLDGSVPHREVPTVMNASDAVLLTSRHEGSPNVVKEALACNRPVVSTDAGDVAARLASVRPSAVATTDAGLVDGLVTVLREGGPSNGRDAVRELGIQRTAERIRSVYERVLDGGDEDRRS